MYASQYSKQCFSVVDFTLSYLDTFSSALLEYLGSSSIHCHYGKEKLKVYETHASRVGAKT